jgi:hypothetical protein
MPQRQQLRSRMIPKEEAEIAKTRTPQVDSFPVSQKIATVLANLGPAPLIKNDKECCQEDT